MEPTKINGKVSYIYLEMILPSDKHQDVIAGLFTGFISYGGIKYIVLTGPINKNVVLNLDHYKYLSVCVLEPAVKHLFFMTKDEADQKASSEMMEDLYRNMKLDGLSLSNDSDFIDITKYINVPPEFLDGKPIDTVHNRAYSGFTGAGKVAPTTPVGSQVHRYSPNNVGGYTQTVVKKDPEPTFFKSKPTAKLTAKDIENMGQRIDRVISGQILPVIPIFPIVEEDPKKYGIEKVWTTAAGYQDMCG